MRILLKYLSDKFISVEVDQATSVSDVKSRIEMIEGIPCGDQILIFRANKLIDTYALADYHICEDSVVQLYDTALILLQLRF